MRKADSHRMCYALVVFTLSLSLGACAFINVQSASSLTLREWIDLQVFTPFILWPEPKGVSLLLRPSRIQGRGREYVELIYSERFIGPDVDPPIYQLYESDSDLAVGRWFLADYVPGEPEVTVNNTRLAVCGKMVSIRILENTSLPASGIAVFEVVETHIVFHWRQESRNTALDILEHNCVQVREDDLETILSFDHLLGNRFPTPDV